MKYIKTYRVFESIDSDIISTVNDMLLELRDNDIDVKAIASKSAWVNTVGSSDGRRVISGDWIFVMFRDIPSSQWSYIDGFTDKSIDGVINNIDEYLESNGFAIYKDPEYYVLDRYNSGYEDEPRHDADLRWIELIYKKL